MKAMRYDAVDSGCLARSECFRAACFAEGKEYNKRCFGSESRN